MNLEYRSGRHIDFDVGDAKRAPIFWPSLDESGRGDQQQQRDGETCAAAISWPCFVAMCYRYQSIAKQTAETSTTDFVIFQQMHGLLGHLSRILSRPLLTIDLIPGNFMSIFYHYSTNPKRSTNKILIQSDSSKLDAGKKGRMFPTLFTHGRQSGPHQMQYLIFFFASDIFSFFFLKLQAKPILCLGDDQPTIAISWRPEFRSASIDYPRCRSLLESSKRNAFSPTNQTSPVNHLTNRTQYLLYIIRGNRRTGRLNAFPMKIDA